MMNRQEEICHFSFGGCLISDICGSVFVFQSPNFSLCFQHLIFNKYKDIKHLNKSEKLQSVFLTVFYIKFSYA
jgi:hypothetical protein